MRFSYKNTIGFGKTCEDHEIKVVGATYRSEEQKERSEVGRSSRKCEETTRKVVDGKEEIEIFVEESKVTMKPSSSWTESRREYKVTVDGKVVRIEENEKKEVTSRNGKISYRIIRSADDVMILETPINRVIYDAKTLKQAALTYRVQKSCSPLSAEQQKIVSQKVT